MAAGPQHVPVVEYFNAGFGHYFMTADADEITGLDGGAFGGAFVRTGRQFNAWNAPTTGTVPVCRFFTTPGTFGPKSSHFYTADRGRVRRAQAQPELDLREDRVPHRGACGRRVRRSARCRSTGCTTTGRRGAPNHRFTTDLALYQQFIGTMGWLPENIGFCAPLARA